MTKTGAAKRLLTCFPHNPIPPKSGDDRRFLSFLTLFRSLGFEISLISADYFSTTPWTAESFEKFHQEFGGRVLLYQAGVADRAVRSAKWTLQWGHHPFYHIPARLQGMFQKAFAELQPELVFFTYIFLEPLFSQEIAAKCTTVFDAHALPSLHKQLYGRVCEELKANRRQALLDEQFYRGYMPKVADYEIAAYDKFDISIAICQAEHDLLAGRTKHTKVCYIPFFCRPAPQEPSFEGSPVFVGSRSAFNTQAYYWFAERVLPLILRIRPDYQLRVAGGLCADVAQVPGIELVGFVENLEELYLSSRCAVCPLLAGSGQSVKVLDAMSFGLPVVALDHVAQRCELRPGIEGLTAARPSQFAQACITLSDQLEMCKSMGRAAKIRISERFSPESSRELLVGLIDESRRKRGLSQISW
jgi:glycosyltransferase involved in cell wall biosynthesis